MSNNRQRFGLNRTEPRVNGLTVSTVRFGFINKNRSLNGLTVLYLLFFIFFLKKIVIFFLIQKIIIIVFKQSFHFRPYFHILGTS